ncbi:cyclic-phosphate processing receiver domain-containing protein [Paludibacterium yongneupense]|uniref:cyclic-phosphate processing receiver domain-containing protein n=1 Tax=Paludibacterium yongneupense TaxID=400061 RepID=UPI00048AF39C|nr:cyclic-phosphate processing receiver domain-containing protein [Paludibacterium yongneupense]
MKVFLDDERVTPAGWVRTFWPEEVIALLKTGQVTELSLDHDLGDDERGTGYTVLLWLEEQVVVHGMRPPLMRVHSANSSARLKMEAAIEAINRHAQPS